MSFSGGRGANLLSDDVAAPAGCSHHIDSYTTGKQPSRETVTALLWEHESIQRGKFTVPLLLWAFEWVRFNSYFNSMILLMKWLLIISVDRGQNNNRTEQQEKKSKQGTTDCIEFCRLPGGSLQRIPIRLRETTIGKREKQNWLLSFVTG